MVQTQYKPLQTRTSSISEPGTIRECLGYLAGERYIAPAVDKAQGWTVDPKQEKKEEHLGDPENTMRLADYMLTTI